MTTLFLDERFYLFLAAAIVLQRWLAPRFGPDARAALLAAVSLFFLSRLQNAATFLPLQLAYAGVLAAAGLVLARLPAGSARRVLFLAGLAGCLLLLVLVKYPGMTESLAGRRDWLAALAALPWAGLSYTTFRAVDLLLQARSGRLPACRPLQVLAYLLFFPAFTAGPINRFRPFLADLETGPSPMPWERLRGNLLRLGFGLVKILVLGRLAYLNAIVSPGFDELLPAPGWRLALGLYWYYLYIYLDFSGYCDAAIAIADCLGIRLPENFRWPVLAANLQDFWNRWHISLSHWCRDYVFFPLNLTFVSRWRLGGLSATCLAAMTTFLLIGLWHGDAWHWLGYGAWHGLGVAGHALYNHGLARRWPNPIARLRANPLYRILCVVLTFNYVSWGLLLTLPPARLARLFLP